MTAGAVAPIWLACAARQDQGAARAGVWPDAGRAGIQPDGTGCVPGSVDIMTRPSLAIGHDNRPQGPPRHMWQTRRLGVRAIGLHRVTFGACRRSHSSTGNAAVMMGVGSAVSIVCKTPGVGGGKSRLRPLLGAELVQQLSACFLRDVAAALDALPEALGRQLYALFSLAGSEAALRALLPHPWRLIPRQDASVGIVLQTSIAAFLADGHGERNVERNPARDDLAWVSLPAPVAT